MRSTTLYAALAFAVCGMAPALAEEVDLELVLAVDISYSMDYDELGLQRSGYVEAIASKPVVDAIKSGSIGKIAVTYVEWAGANQQQQIIGWQIIEDQQSADAFAAKLAESPLRRSYRTSISSALLFSAPLFDGNGFDGARRVIDISGDGVNNQGPSITATRDALVAKGIAINGLPLLIRPSTSNLDISNLDDYYKDCVIGGPGAFVIPVKDRAAFTEAIRTKLILEIAAIEPPARLIPTQARPRVPCSIGERLWDERYGGSGGYGGGGGYGGN